MMLHVQTHLRSGVDLTSLTTQFGITVKRHRVLNNLVLLKYDQFESPMAEPIVQECRGLILDEADDWAIVGMAYHKFFNYGEGHAAAIDWESASVQEKVDGSLCLLYPYKGEWMVATTGTADAGGPVNDAELTFAEYFWDTLGGRDKCPKEQDYCFFFELAGPLNRVVVPHEKAFLTLLGARSNKTWKEVRPGEVSHFFPWIKVVREFSLTNVNDIMTTFESMSPLQQEGYVVVDASFKRLKVKHPGYVALHHAKDGLTQSAFVNIARTGEIPEFFASFPEFGPLMEETLGRYNKLVAELEATYDKYKDIPVQKDFAMAVKELPGSSVLFQLRAGKVKSIKEFLAYCHIDLIMRLLGYK